MRKLLLISTAALGLAAGALGTDAAQAQGYGYRGNNGGYARGPAYGNRGGRGISTGAAVGLGVAGLAAGAIAADAARRNGYGNGYGYQGRPGYGYYDDE